MIQRKQTIYLLLAFICNVLLLFFPIFVLTAVNGGEEQVGYFGAYGIETETYSQSYPVFVVFIIMAIMTAFSIALYKNRKRQLLVCRFNLIFHTLITLGFVTFYYAGRGVITEQIEESGASNASLDTGLGFFLCVAAIPFILLAIRGIRADEALLRSIDRIR